MYSRLGCKGPVPLPMPELVDAMEIWSAMLSDATDISFHERMEEGTPDLNIWKEIARSLTGESNFTLPALGLAAIETWPDRFMPGRQNQVQSHDLICLLACIFLAPHHCLLSSHQPPSFPWPADTHSTSAPRLTTSSVHLLSTAARRWKCLAGADGRPPRPIRRRPCGTLVSHTPYARPSARPAQVPGLQRRIHSHF